MGIVVSTVKAVVIINEIKCNICNYIIHFIYIYEVYIYIIYICHIYNVNQCFLQFKLLLTHS